MYSFPLDSNCLMGGFWVLFLLIHLLRLLISLSPWEQYCSQREVGI